MENNWHTKNISEVFGELGTSENGLDLQEVSLRIKKFGLNKLPEAKTDGIVIIFIRQFQSPLIYILLAACFIVFLMGEFIDGAIILLVLIFNAIIGSVQEGRAQNTISVLKKFAETNTTVLRGGKELILRDKEVVPGDIIILQEGEKVSADARIIFSHNLRVDESALTGESVPVHKDEKIGGNIDLPITDQRNMVFKGTNIVSGNAKAVVVETGLRTIIGKISKEIASIDTEIPLKTNIRYLSRLIVIGAVSIGVALFLFGILTGKPLREMFVTVVSLLVSIIPEGLPIVITLVLATGVWRMSKHNALVKRLQAVEALGQSRIIAVDKTGTITKNELMVQKVYTDGKIFDVDGTGYEPKGKIKFEGKKIDPMLHPEVLLLGKISAFCANARVMFSKESKQWRVAGDPTEAAMLVFSEKVGFNKNNLEGESPEILEIPFDYKTKYHATLHKVDNKRILAVAGAPEVIISLSKKIKKGENISLINETERQDLESVFIKMSEDGMRVVALAVGYNAKENVNAEKLGEITFIGFLGMRDTLRKEITNSIKKAEMAGIKVVMITGDHKVTARAIARDAGIYKDGDKVFIGTEIDNMTDKELASSITGASVFARVTPEHKIRIIRSYKSNGEIIAMTGDGVNDAPSLVAADLGIAMGKTGTEVTKEASDIILLDDNFESIIFAVEEGRSIYKTIKKVILYLFAGSWSQVLTIVFSLFIGFPLPLLPSQIIWLNFVTDGFLDVALAMEPKEKGLLQRSFERPKKYLIDLLTVKRAAIMSIALAAGTLALFSMYYRTDIVKAWTIALTTLAVGHWFNAWNCRSEEKSIFQMNPFSNRFLFLVTILIIILQLLAVYNPFLQNILHTSPLLISEWILIVIIASLVVIVEEVRKLFYRNNLKKI